MVGVATSIDITQAQGRTAFRQFASLYRKQLEACKMGRADVVEIAKLLKCPVCGGTHDKAGTVSSSTGFDVPIRTGVSVIDGKIESVNGSSFAWDVDENRPVLCLCCAAEFDMRDQISWATMRELLRRWEDGGQQRLPDSVKVDNK